ncbi:GH24546 [Drosophila grimshawi]|uniref:GH24546 n=1 Tax=Drosophila grimshawi TaxID=7222 RepID=B4JLY4_DROGR|nr:GH24546 [Drosophila grimshawi]
MRRPSALSRNHYFVIGLLLGLVLSCYIPQNIRELVQQEECPQEVAENLLIERFGQDFEPHLNLINKPLAAKKPVSHLTLSLKIDTYCARGPCANQNGEIAESAKLSPMRNIY